LSLSERFCAVLGIDYSEYGARLTERTGDGVIEHLCRVASGLESLIMGDDQIITQVREALEFSRNRHCTDGYMETVFNLSVHAAKAVKTKVFVDSLRTSAVPEHAVEKLKTMRGLSGKNALVIGGGRIGRRVCELLIRENMNVTVTLRSHSRGAFNIAGNVNTVNYDERYGALEKADVAVSATSSPHTTISTNEIAALRRLPAIIADLAVPRDVEPSVGGLDGVTLLTIDDISGDGRRLPPESALAAESVIAEHVARYNRWRLRKEKIV
jgi:glutamyl-tRNA reductase